MKNSKDKRTLFFLFTIIALRILLWWYEPNYYLVGLPFIVSSVFILYCIKHNHLHYPVFNSIILNRIYENILGVFTGTSMKGAYVIHLVNHHQENNNEKDWGNTNLNHNKYEAVNLVKYAFTTPLKFLKAKQKWFKNNSYKDMGLFGNFESWVIIFVYALMLIIKLDATLMYIILPHLMGQFILVSFNYFQHAGCDHLSDFNHSRNFTGKFINYLTFNNGFHTAHHHFPTAHWSEYNVIHDSIQNQIEPYLNENNFIYFFVRLLFNKKRKAIVLQE